MPDNSGSYSALRDQTNPALARFRGDRGTAYGFMVVVFAQLFTLVELPTLPVSERLSPFLH